AVNVVPDRVRRGDLLTLLVGELSRLAAVAAHRPRRGLVLAGAAPFEVQRPRVSGPAQPRGRIADEPGPAHDAVDGQLEPRRGRGGDEDEGEQGDDGRARMVVHVSSEQVKVSDRLAGSGWAGDA